MPIERLIVLDFEATCDRVASPEPREIIEFPSVLVDLEARTTLDEFVSFVRPVHHPRLTAFCTELTGIVQSEVDAAPVFEEVLHRHLQWVRAHGLLERPASVAMVTCGDWDLSRMLPMQCEVSGLSLAELPLLYRRWINIKRVFTGLRGRKRGSLGMVKMLRDLGLELVGRHHRGIDDSRNIARMVLALAAQGARFDDEALLRPSPEAMLTSG